MRLLLLVLTIVAASTTAASKGHTMPSQGFLKLSDDGFWAPKLDLKSSMLGLMDSGFEGVAFDAPRAVDVSVRSSLPAATLSLVTDEWSDWSLGENSILVGCEVDRFDCRAAQVAPPTRQRRPGPPPPKTSGASEGQIGSTAVIDARPLLQLPWEPGVWQMLLVTRDRRSEPARVVLHSGGALPPRPSPLPGAHLTLSASGKGLDAILEVRMKARASRAALGGDHGKDVGVPVTLVVTGQDRPVPYVVRRAVSGHWGPAGEPEHVAASARIALKELVPAGVQDSALYVWAFAGDQVSTPVRVALP